MLAIIQVGHVEASDRYIRNKVKAVMQAGMTAEVINLPETCYSGRTGCNHAGWQKFRVQGYHGTASPS